MDYYETISFEIQTGVNYHGPGVGIPSIAFKGRQTAKPVVEQSRTVLITTIDTFLELKHFQSGFNDVTAWSYDKMGVSDRFKD